MLEINDQDFAFAKGRKPRQEPEITPLFHTENYDFIAGWLKKQSQKFNDWKFCYVVLTEAKLKYYSHQNSSNPSGIFNFSQLTATISPLQPSCFAIEFHNSTHKLVFQAKDSSERDQWLLILNTQISNIPNRNTSHNILATKPEFWRIERVSDFWFQNNASTGDLLLIRSKSFASVLHRGLAQSTFDQLGILLCYSSGKICVLHATEESGIVMVNWEEFVRVNWMKKCNAIAFRKLEVVRDEDFLEKFGGYIEENIGKKMKFSAGQIRNRKKLLNRTERLFLYSEFVSSAYKALGFLDGNCNPPAVWPVCFEKLKHLDLVDATFGSLLLIDFDLL